MRRLLPTALLLLFSHSSSACYRYPKGKRSPCDDLRCGPGEDCVVTQNAGVLSAQCVCPSTCPSYGDSGVYLTTCLHFPNTFSSQLVTSLCGLSKWAE
ncbi:hypothetical protein OSTOST_18117, partial [Ostertagia ostertagi]